RIRRPTDGEPDAVFEAGDVAFIVAPRVAGLPVDPVRQANLAGTIPFNRPPRNRPPMGVDALTAPEEPKEASRPRFSFASAFGPLILGVVMVLVLKNILFALFCLLSPVMVIGSWLEQRRQGTRGARRDYEEKRRVFKRDVAARQEEELTRRRESFPDLAEITRRATAPDPRL